MAIKKGTYNKLKFTIEPYTKLMYGHYLIKGTYKGKNVNVVTTNASLYDNLDDDNVKKQNEARKTIYTVIKNYVNS